MPNHITNVLKIEGALGDISKCMDTIRGETIDLNRPFIIDFEKILPIPELIRHSGSGRTIIDGQMYDEWYFEYGDGSNWVTKDRPFTPQEYVELAKYDQRNWYDWACANWGTKWNAYDQSILDDNLNEVSIQFNTAWASPTPVIEALSNMFPSLKFTLTYADEDLGSNTGRLKFANGILTEQFCPEYATHEAYEIVLEINDYASEYIKLVDGVYTYVNEEDEEYEEEVA